MYLPRDLPELPVQALCCAAVLLKPQLLESCVYVRVSDLLLGKKNQKCDTPKNLSTSRQVKNVSTKTLLYCVGGGGAAPGLCS